MRDTTAARRLSGILFAGSADTQASLLGCLQAIQATERETVTDFPGQDNQASCLFSCQNLRRPVTSCYNHKYPKPDLQAGRRLETNGEEVVPLFRSHGSREGRPEGGISKSSDRPIACTETSRRYCSGHRD